MYSGNSLLPLDYSYSKVIPYHVDNAQAARLTEESDLSRAISNSGTLENIMHQMGRISRKME